MKVMKRLCGIVLCFSLSFTVGTAAATEMNILSGVWLQPAASIGAFAK